MNEFFKKILSFLILFSLYPSFLKRNKVLKRLFMLYKILAVENFHLTKKLSFRLPAMWRHDETRADELFDALDIFKPRWISADKLMSPSYK